MKLHELQAILSADPSDQPELAARIQERAGDEDHFYGAWTKGKGGRASASSVSQHKSASKIKSMHSFEPTKLRAQWDKRTKNVSRAEKAADTRRNKQVGELQSQQALSYPQSLTQQERTQHVRGIKRLLNFMTEESTRIQKKYRWSGKNPDQVVSEIGQAIGGGDPSQSPVWQDLMKWSGHETMRVELTQRLQIFGELGSAHG